MPQKIHIYRYLLLTLATLFMAQGAAAKEITIPPRAQALAAHKALYEIKLLSKRSASQIINVNGKMFYEWTQGCDAWETRHRFDLLYEYSDSPSMRITSDFSTFETFDGKTLDFSSRRMRDGEIFEEVRGHAEIPAQKKGMANYTLPKKIKYALPKGSVFPMGHTMDVIAQIKEGNKIYSATVFDGSDEQGPRQATAFIGKPTKPFKPMLKNKAIDQNILGSPAHNLRLAYFILSEQGLDAEHEMDVVFHENGVISAMVIDYDDFSISQKLVALEPVEPSCGTKPKEINNPE